MADNDVKIKVSLDGADGVQKGLDGVGSSAGNADSKLGGLASKGLAGAGLALAGFAVAAVAAAGALAVGVVGAYAAYEQNIGGIETLFGASAGKMEAYAADAYKTAGLSANEYLSQATSFSASLLQGLGGDTDAAAEVANRAITDMSDNANKFGSDIGMIQNAYQGFAKDNFTMLDNLKLGYGGTASEMARLVNESGVLGDSFTATAENINDVSYDQIIAAIGAVQDKLGVTGTTAKEAASTISGSVATMKGAFDNLLVGLGSSDADVAKLAGNVISSFEQVVTNITPVIDNIGNNIDTLAPKIGTMTEGLVGVLATALPVILDAGVALVGGLVTGITMALPGLITALLPGVVGLVQTLSDLAPQLVAAGALAVVALAEGLAGAAPQLIPAIVIGVLGMVHALIEAAPLLLDAGIQLVMGLVTGILDSIPFIIDALPGIIEGIVAFIETGVPMLLEAGIQLFMGLVTALPVAIDQIVAVLPSLITSIIGALTSAIPLLVQAGITLLTALVTALPTIITSIVAALPLIITSILTAVLGAIPQLVEGGIQLFVALIGALPQIIVALVGAIPQITTALLKGIVGAVPQLIMAGVQLFVALISNLPLIIGTILGAVPQIIGGLISAFSENVGKMSDIGRNLLEGIWKGITGGAGWLFGKIKGFANDVVSNIAGFFGVKSPSTRMRDEIGAFLPAGIGVGVERHAADALKPIRGLNEEIMAEALKLNTSVAFTSEASMTQTLVPMQATAQQQGRMSVEATLDPYLISSAIADSFAANDRSQDQTAVSLSRDSISMLASAIVDSIRVQSRQGVSVLG